MGLAIDIIGAIIALAAAGIAMWQAGIARNAARRASLLQLFTSFDSANRATLAKPELLYSVHGLDASVSEDEAARIAYLSMLLDGFQHFYDELYQGNFERMVLDFKARPTFLNRILAVKENQRRWELMKSMYYHSFDDAFVKAIDELLQFEGSGDDQAQRRSPLGCK